MSKPKPTTQAAVSVARGESVAAYPGCPLAWQTGQEMLPDDRTFGGHSAEEVASLCDILARSADRMTNSYSETASIARRARDAIRFLLGMEVPPDV